jgi:hypothetical protein
MTLLLAAWVSASGPVGICQRQNLDGLSVRERIPGADKDHAPSDHKVAPWVTAGCDMRHRALARELSRRDLVGRRGAR